MDKQAAMVKLAQIKLAINYVLRQRRSKQAAFYEDAQSIAPNALKPISDKRNSYSSPKSVDLVPSSFRRDFGDRLLPDEGVYYSGKPYRPVGWKGEIDPENSDYQAAMLRDAVAPLWNRFLDRWDYQRRLPGYKWNEKALNYASTYADLSGTFNNDDFDEAYDVYKQVHPHPPKPEPMPEELYINIPYTIRNNNGTQRVRYRVGPEPESIKQEPMPKELPKPKHMPEEVPRRVRDGVKSKPESTKPRSEPKAEAY